LELTFANMRNVPMLQAVDLLVFELRRYYVNLRMAPHVRMRRAARKLRDDRTAIGSGREQSTAAHAGGTFLGTALTALRGMVREYSGNSVVPSNPPVFHKGVVGTQN
jgi:hypothetical protein